MKLNDVLRLGNKFARPHQLPYEWYGYHDAGDGPFANLGCIYIAHYDKDFEPQMSTSIDLYPEDILAEDWVIIND